MIEVRQHFLVRRPADRKGGLKLVNEAGHQRFSRGIESRRQNLQTARTVLPL
jgi:hypothetical protein